MEPSPQYKEFLWALMPVVKSKSINVNSNNVTMINQGTQNVTINGVLLLKPDAAITFPAYPGEMTVMAFDITFPNDLQPGCRLVIIMKEYKQ